MSRRTVAEQIEPYKFALSLRAEMWAERLRGLRTISLESLELGMAVIGGVVGLHVHGDPQGMYAQAPTLKDWAHFVPLSWWAWILIPAALATLVGYVDQSYSLRRAACAAAGLFWIYTGVILMIRHYALYGWCLHLPMGIYNAWAFLRLGEQCVRHKYKVLRATMAISNVVTPPPEAVRELALKEAGAWQ